MILNEFIIHLSKVLLNPWGMLKGVVGAEGQTHISLPYTLITKLMRLAAYTALQATARCNNTQIHTLMFYDIRKGSAGTPCLYILIFACYYAIQLNMFYS